MTNYYQQKQQESLAAAKAQIAQAVAHYEYPSQRELELALMELKLLNLQQAASTINIVADKLATLDSKQKSCNCGCTGKSGSAGKYETKSVTSNGSARQTKSSGLFASAYEQVQADAAFEAFCSKFPYMCNER